MQRLKNGLVTLGVEYVVEEDCQPVRKSVCVSIFEVSPRGPLRAAEYTGFEMGNEARRY